VLCRGAPKAPYPSYWGWFYGSGGGIGPSSVGGVAALPRRLCGYAVWLARILGRGSADSAGPWSSRL